MSYEDDDDDGGGGGDRGKLVAVASFYAVHEAELARTRLLADGIPAYVWGAQTIGVNPLWSVAMKLRVAVPERDAPRARIILGPMADAYGDAHRPVFRVRGNRGATGFGVGIGAGLAVGGSLMVARQEWAWLCVALVPAAIGFVMGERVRADLCSGCRKELPADPLVTCPSCHRTLRGTIDDIEDRLAAEDALDDAAEADEEQR